MKYIHVRSLEKYHPGYKDRTLQWGKIYFQMAQGDPDCEMIENEIDWSRLIRFILLELQAKRPIPVDERYLTFKGINLKKRPISKTIQALHNFLDIVTLDDESPLRNCNVDKEEDKEKDIENGTRFAHPTNNETRLYFKELEKPLEADRFYDYFQSNGWKVGGRAPMKDWKAAARNWCRRAKSEKFSNLSRAQKTTLKTLEDFNADRNLKQDNTTPHGLISGD